jgi:hypothetical protein
MPTEEELVAEGERTMYDLAMPLFNRHLDDVRLAMKLGFRSAAMLHWASLQTIFGRHPGARAILDEMLPALKAMPSEPRVPAAASPAPQGG